jgi:hypothetical protein
MTIQWMLGRVLGFGDGALPPPPMQKMTNKQAKLYLQIKTTP